MINEVPKQENQTPERHRTIQRLIEYGVTEMFDFITDNHNSNTLLLTKYLDFLRANITNTEKNVINTLFQNINHYLAKLQKLNDQSK